ncbi:MAG TPA: hypothetical protein GX701_04950 [Clostridiales bacterium]|nr:hypothetical protein [Clostridiales bacterium]
MAANPVSEYLAQAYDFIWFAMDYETSLYGGELHVSNEITNQHFQMLAEGVPVERLPFVTIPARRGLLEPMLAYALSVAENIQNFVLADDAYASVLYESMAYALGMRYHSMEELSDAIEAHLWEVLQN